MDFSPVFYVKFVCLNNPRKFVALVSKYILLIANIQELMFVYHQTYKV